MSSILNGLDGVVCLMDDILIYGSNQEEHDQRLEATLNKLEKAGVTLNQDKCEFAKTTMKFLGHIVGAEGIKPDPDKVKAITSMLPPATVPEVRQFLGMINELSKFSANISDLAEPLRALLAKNSCWVGLKTTKEHLKISRKN